MAPADHAKAHFGMWIQELQRGRAVLSMRVRKEMTNGFAITHGGVVFALADTAFAYACNETEAQTVASGAEISFLRPSAARSEERRVGKEGRARWRPPSSSKSR